MQLEHASEMVSENLRKIDDHVLAAGPADAVTASARKEFEQARQLFVEQLEYLDKEKDRLIEDLPPLAPVASEEDVSSDETGAAASTSRAHMDGGDDHGAISAVARRKNTKSSLSSTLSRSRPHVEYAIDFSTPPLFPQLTHATKDRPARPTAVRRPTMTFLATILGLTPRS